MSRRVAALLIILLVSAPAIHSGSLGAPVVYQVEDLGKTADGLVPTVTGINASGQVSGYVNGPVGLRAVRYTDGVGWAYLPGLQSVFSLALGINASGDLTGYYMPSTALRAYRYVDGPGVTTIGVLTGGTSSIGLAIADNGDVVGHGNSPTGQRAWRASPGLLPIVPAALQSSVSSACGVNAAGQMVGTFRTGGFDHAFRLESDGSLTDIGTLGGTTSSACGLDADGRVVGLSKVGTATHAFLFSGTTLTDVDGFNSSVSRLVAFSNGVGVGSFISSTTEGKLHALLYTDAGGAVDLNSRIPSGSGWVLSDAVAVSPNGKIVGHGFLEGAARVFRLTPGAAVDTTKPVITSVTATPSTIWPPKGQMVTVTISAAATDNSGATPTCTLTSITIGGTPAPDASVTPPDTGSVKAVGGRTYTFNEKCVDPAGNEAWSSVDVTVPRDEVAPVIATLTASPSSIVPPNRAMVPVTLSVGATDDVDDTPACSLSAITAAGATDADFSITGPFSAAVSAVGGRTYALTVTCTDATGNPAKRSVDVVVPPDSAAPDITTVTATPSTIWPPKGQTVMVTTSAVATDNSGDAPVCTLANITVGGAAAPDATVTGANTATVKAVGGRTYTFNEKCVDGSSNQAWSWVDVTVPRDVTAPVISTLTASPASITPPNRTMVPVTVSVRASDDVDDAPVCGLSGVTAAGAAAGDYSITPPYSAAVRAVAGRTYSLTVTCTDAAGNPATRSVDVVVPPDTAAPLVTSLSATPSAVWPPDDAMAAVSVAVTATDDSAETPVCKLSGITSVGASLADYSITGQYAGLVRAVGGRTYSLRVTCSDSAGNSRDASVNVLVTPDTTAPVIKSLSATPNYIWPPNGKMESVTLSVTATDDVDAEPKCTLTSITGAAAGFAVVTGPLTANVRSDKDVVYTLNVMCGDRVGNKSQASVAVTIGKDPHVAATSSSKK
jgi:probable HAF family extracellular repeat protein